MLHPKETKYDLRLREIEASDYISQTIFSPKISYDSIMEHSNGRSLSVRVVDGVAMDCGGALPNNVETYLVKSICVHQKGTITTLVSKPNQKEIKSIREEEKNMSDLELYMKDLSVEARTTQDILTAHLREATRVLSLTTKDVRFKVEGYCKVFVLSAKFDFINETRYVQFVVTKKECVWSITYNVYSYTDFLRTRTIETASVVELQMFMRSMLEQDLVLETNPTL